MLFEYYEKGKRKGKNACEMEENKLMLYKWLTSFKEAWKELKYLCKGVYVFCIVENLG